MAASAAAVAPAVSIDPGKPFATFVIGVPAPSGHRPDSDYTDDIMGSPTTPTSKDDIAQSLTFMMAKALDDRFNVFFVCHASMWGADANKREIIEFAAEFCAKNRINFGYQSANEDMCRDPSRYGFYDGEMMMWDGKKFVSAPLSILKSTDPFASRGDFVAGIGHSARTASLLAKKISVKYLLCHNRADVQEDLVLGKNELKAADGAITFSTQSDVMLRDFCEGGVEDPSDPYAESKTINLPVIRAWIPPPMTPRERRKHAIGNTIFVHVPKDSDLKVLCNFARALKDIKDTHDNIRDVHMYIDRVIDDDAYRTITSYGVGITLVKPGEIMTRLSMSNIAVFLYDDPALMPVAMYNGVPFLVNSQSEGIKAFADDLSEFGMKMDHTVSVGSDAASDAKVTEKVADYLGFPETASGDFLAMAQIYHIGAREFANMVCLAVGVPELERDVDVSAGAAGAADVVGAAGATTAASVPSDSAIAAPAAPAASAEMPLSGVLESCGLNQYISQLFHAGYECIDDMPNDEKEIRVALKELGFLPGHVNRFTNAIMRHREG